MALENTKTEQDMDAASRQYLQSFRQGPVAGDPDLDVDGLSESILSRLLRLFSSSKS